jgi:sphingomyelin phosphodiesterase
MPDSGTVSPGINFKRDTSNSSSIESTHSDCEGSAIISILGAFTASGATGLTNALVEKMGSAWLDTVIPANYTAAGWNVTSS